MKFMRQWTLKPGVTSAEMDADVVTHL